MVQPAIPWDPAPNATRDAIIFLIYTAIALVLALVGVYAAHRHSETVGFVLMLCVCVAVAFENVTIGVVSIVPLASSVVMQGMFRLRIAVQCFIIPMFITCLFELNYEVHKARSSNFCGCIRFDRGHRKAGVLGKLVRYSAWLVALALLLLEIVVSAPYMTDPLVSWQTLRYTNKSLGIYRTAGNDIGWSDVMDFVPTATLLLFAGYTGFSLWRYGTTMSTDVRTTSVNPWVSIIGATAGIAIAWALTPKEWPLPYAMNACLLGLLGATVLTLALVELNLSTLDTWSATLERANEAVIAAMARNQKERELVALIRRKKQLAAHSAGHGRRRQETGFSGSHLTSIDEATDDDASSRGYGGADYSARTGLPRAGTEIEMVPVGDSRGARGQDAGQRSARRRRAHTGSSGRFVRRANSNVTAGGTMNEGELEHVIDELLGNDLTDDDEDDGGEDADDLDQHAYAVATTQDFVDGSTAAPPIDEHRKNRVTSPALLAQPASEANLPPGSGQITAEPATTRSAPMRTLSMGADLHPGARAGSETDATGRTRPVRSFDGDLLPASVVAAVAAAEHDGQDTAVTSLGRLASFVGRQHRTTPAHWKALEERWEHDAAAGSGRVPLWARPHRDSQPRESVSTSMAISAPPTEDASAAAPAISVGSSESRHIATTTPHVTQLAAYINPAARNIIRSPTASAAPSTVPAPPPPAPAVPTRPAGAKSDAQDVQGPV